MIDTPKSFWLILIAVLVLPAWRFQQSEEEAQYQRAESYFSYGRYYRAYYEYVSFGQRFPESKRLREAIRKEMDSARLTAEHGYDELFLGVPLTRSSKKGIDLLRQSLYRHPFEDFSDDYSLWIAHQLFKEGKSEEALLEYESFIKVYPSSELYREALFQIARCYLRRFDSVYYDSSCLADARRYFKFLLDKYPDYERVAEVKRYLAFVDERESEKYMMIADFYHSWGKHRSEAIYLKIIVKNYPETRTAQQARNRLAEYQGRGMVPELDKPGAEEKK